MDRTTVSRCEIPIVGNVVKVLRSTTWRTRASRTLFADPEWRGEAPLWFYILKEAEIVGKGRELGPVGGRIVAEVLVGLLQKDPNSYLYLQPGWKPAPPIAPATRPVHHGRSPQVRAGLVLTTEVMNFKAIAMTYVRTDVNEVMNMQEIDRERVDPAGASAGGSRAAGMALAAALTLAGCHEAQGGGYIGAARGRKPRLQWSGQTSASTSSATTGVKGQITYHDTSTNSILGGVLFPELRLHGTVENVLIDDDPSITIPAVPAYTCEDLVESPWAQFQGSYRSQETKLLSKPPGKFTVLVFDQGEPGRTKDPQITGDGFSIDLNGGPYPLYTRAGYIEGGNIQVDN